MTPILEVRGLTRYFGGLAAVSGVDLSVAEGEILGLIGPNGAGKSTFFNLVSGSLKSTGGAVLFEGRDVTALAAHRRAALGIGRAFQAATLFANLSAFENVFSGLHVHYRTSLAAAFLHLGRARAEERAMRAEAARILDFMGLSAFSDTQAKNLPHGHQKALGMAMGMATKPKLLLLDEPFTGMHPEETAAMAALVGRVRDGGTTVVIVEHNVQAVMRLCDRLAVLNHGRKIAEGSPSDVAADPEVIEAYLGTDEEEEDG